MITIAKSMAVAVFYFVVACIIEETANYYVEKLKKKHLEQRS